MQGRPLVFIDVETTGGMAYSSRILEIGALRVENGEIVAKMSQVLDPQEPLPGWITSLTGIEQGETLDQPTFAELQPQIADLLNDAIFVAHNVNFDYSFFREEYRKLGCRFAMDKLCTVQLSRALFPNERSHRLDEVISRHGYTVARRHRAYDDAEVLYRFWTDNLARFGSERLQMVAQRLIWPNQSKLFL